MGNNSFQTDVDQFMKSLGNISPALDRSYGGANQIAGITSPTPVYGMRQDPTSKKKDLDRTQIGSRWNPLALQSQLPSYQQDVNQATAQIDQWAPNAMAASESAMNMGLTAADMASGAVPGLYNLGGAFTGAAGSTLGQANAAAPQLQNYMNEALQQGFDPQQALFNRQAQLMRDVTGASNAAAGIAGSPYGAGVANQGMENFLLDWQNQQLQREATAAGTAQGLAGTEAGLYNISQGLGDTAAGLDTSALGLGQGATQLAATAGQLPIQTAEAIAQGKIGLQDALSQAKTNMYNQRMGGQNALQSWIGTATNVLGDVLKGQEQNFNMGQANLTDMLGFAGLPFKMLGK